jgi:hypothetical protein
MLELAIAYIFFAVLVGAFATLIKRSGLIWFLISLLISPLLAFIALVVFGRPALPGIIAGFGEKTCPKCAEKIKKKATICRYCGHKFAEPESQKSILYSDIKPLIFTERNKSKFKTREEYEKWRQSKMNK